MLPRFLLLALCLSLLTLLALRMRAGGRLWRAMECALAAFVALALWQAVFPFGVAPNPLSVATVACLGYPGLCLLVVLQAM